MHVDLRLGVGLSRLLLANSERHQGVDDLQSSPLPVYGAWIHPILAQLVMPQREGSSLVPSPNFGGGLGKSRSTSDEMRIRHVMSTVKTRRVPSEHVPEV
jgi:hypothetical protein